MLDPSRRAEAPDIIQGLTLRVVRTDEVRPHEIADPARESRIEARLRDDAILRDPVIVGEVPDVDGYVLLDGTNRKHALANLGYPFILAQVLDYADPHAVELRSWCHTARVPLPRIVQGMASTPGIEVSALPPLAAAEILADPSTLAVLLDRNQRVVLTRTSPGESRAVQLRLLVDQYESSLTRLDCEADNVEETAKSICRQEEAHVSLIAFPRFSRSQVVTIATGGTPIPAGITRHVLHQGRALRVNLPLDILASDDIEAANRALRDHVATLRPRMYREPTLMFDS